MTATDSARTLALAAAHAAADKLAQNVVIIDVSDRLAITDAFVIASGSNERQVSAIVDEVEEQLRKLGVKPTRREGEKDGRWVLLDFLDIVVHVQHNEERVFYALERLWRDCPTFAYEEGPDGPNLTIEDLAKVPEDQLGGAEYSLPSAAMADLSAAAAGIVRDFDGGSAGTLSQDEDEELAELESELGDGSDPDEDDDHSEVTSKDLG
ncbi:ribosome silencing factor [Nakamurella antarctica]|uniref:Ribosomal silencing factor RsfS n=1 Tax=Nakamurella antarctica TaxID=1902245 RepID=A0A3G8ZMH6_9ACTN|nr:ribosome silencing factor [Nakamurella antarctica]AZI58450.1 ribosome silencing factor [Nakamurella antarctica]